MSEEFEELEQIPWAALAAGSAPPRNVYLAVGGLVVLLLAICVWALTRGGEPVELQLATTVPIASTTVTTPPSVTIPATTASPVYTEADLMAIDAAYEERLAVAHAEWLVRDLLTVDGDPQIAERLEELIPGLDRDDTTPTYVEWVDAFAVETVEPGHYRVEVAFRTLAGTPDGYVRQPPGALALEVAIDVGGETRLVASPESVSVPDLLGSSGAGER